MDGKMTRYLNGNNSELSFCTILPYNPLSPVHSGGFLFSTHIPSSGIPSKGSEDTSVSFIG